MTFTVTGRSVRGLSLIACDTVLRALERAADLLRRGYADVLIADGRGAQFTPDQFARFFRPRAANGGPPTHRTPPRGGWSARTRSPSSRPTMPLAR